MVSSKVLPSQSTYISRWRLMVGLGSFFGKEGETEWSEFWGILPPYLGRGPPNI